LIFFAPLQKRDKTTHELNSAQIILHCMAQNSKWTTVTRLCENAFSCTGSESENKFRNWNMTYTNYELYPTWRPSNTCVCLSRTPKIGIFLEN